jgi:hypothetical protein
VLAALMTDNYFSFCRVVVVTSVFPWVETGFDEINHLVVLIDNRMTFVDNIERIVLKLARMLRFIK